MVAGTSSGRENLIGEKDIQPEGAGGGGGGGVAREREKGKKIMSALARWSGFKVTHSMEKKTQKSLKLEGDSRKEVPQTPNQKGVGEGGGFLTKKVVLSFENANLMVLRGEKAYSVAGFDPVGGKVASHREEKGNAQRGGTRGG